MAVEVSAPPPLRTAVLQGLGWLTGAQGARHLLQLGVRVLLVRLLSPDDFGLLAMVTVVTGFLLMFQDLGFGPALVREEKVSSTDLSTVFWLNVVTGGALALLTAALGPLLAWFYDQPILRPVCAGLALASLAAPLGTVHNALLQRQFGFRSLGKVDVLSIMAGGTVGVLMAARGHGVWALVWQSNVTAVATLAVTLVEARWMPQLRFDWRSAARLWQFSGQFTAASVLNYCLRNADNLLVGRFLGAAALGFYSQAYQLMLYPVQYVAALAGRVMFPTLASIQADRDRFRRGYLRALRGIAALTFPLMLGAMVLAPDLFAVLYGPRWQPSVFLFQVLCVIGMVQSIGTTIGWIYLSTGRTDLMLRWTVIVALLVLPGFAIGLSLGGLKGLTIGYAVTAALLFPPSLLPAFRLIRLSVREAIRALLPLFLAAAGTAAVLFATRWLLAPVSGPVARLAVLVPLGVLTYIVLLEQLGQSPRARVATLWGALRGR